MIDARKLDLEVAPRETYWPLDPAIDIAASDVDLWHETGDGLVCHDKQKASKIRWRPLTQLEQEAIYTSDVHGFGLLALICAHALVSIEDVKLGWERVGVLRRLNAESLARFENLGGEVPGRGRVSPIVWLGGLVSRASFRPGG